MTMTIGTWLSANMDTIAFCVMIVAICVIKIVKEWIWFIETKLDSESYHD